MPLFASIIVLEDHFEEGKKKDVKAIDLKALKKKKENKKVAKNATLIDKMKKFFAENF